MSVSEEEYRLLKRRYPERKGVMTTMRTAKQIAEEAKTTGRVWIEGEMEFPNGLTIHEAKAHAVKIAEACGYLVRWYNGTRSMLEICGGYMPGHVVLDWYDSDRPGPSVVHVYTPDSAYFN